jgi:hypothetical protein
MKTITATVPAWLTNASDRLSHIASMAPERAVSAIVSYLPHSDVAPEGWIKVGMSEITITFDDPAEVTESQIASLRAAKRKVQADCEIALMQLDGQIQSLLAIEAPKVAE